MAVCSPWEILLPIWALALVAHLALLGESGQSVFGVQTTVDYAASEAHRKLRRSYLQRVWLHTLSAAAVPALLDYWGVALGLVVVAWQAMQAGMAWWSGHMEALAHEAEPASLQPTVSGWDGLASSHALRVGPYVLLAFVALRSASISDAQDMQGLLSPFLVGIAACAVTAIAARLSGREPAALAAQYLIAFASGYWGWIQVVPLAVPSVSAAFHSIFLLGISHLAFFSMKEGLVGFDPEWASRPGFDSPPRGRFVAPGEFAVSL